jgi:hypothetical protein
MRFPLPSESCIDPNVDVAKEDVVHLVLVPVEESTCPGLPTFPRESLKVTIVAVAKLVIPVTVTVPFAAIFVEVAFVVVAFVATKFVAVRLRTESIFAHKVLRTFNHVTDDDETVVVARVDVPVTASVPLVIILPALVTVALPPIHTAPLLVRFETVVVASVLVAELSVLVAVRLP